MGGDGRLKRQATTLSASDMAGLVKDLKAAPYEEKEGQVHLMDVVALHQTSNPAALVAGGAIRPLVLRRRARRCPLCKRSDIHGVEERERKGRPDGGCVVTRVTFNMILIFVLRLYSSGIPTNLTLSTISKWAPARALC